MAASVVQVLEIALTTDATATSAAFATTTGDTLHVCWGDPNANVNVTDSVHGSTGWAQGGSDFATGGLTGQGWTHENITGNASHTVTLTTGAGTMDTVAYVVHMRGLATASYDSTSFNTASENDASSPYTVAPAALAQANNITVSLMFCNNNPTTVAVGAPYTKQQEEMDTGTFWASAVATHITSSTTPVDASWTDSATAGTVGLMCWSFKEAVGGGTSILRQMMMQH